MNALTLPLSERLSLYAAETGSKAKTTRGRLRAIRGWSLHDLTRDMLRPHRGSWRVAWEDRQERKRDPELYRGRSDSKFRSLLVLKLQREAKRLTQMPTTVGEVIAQRSEGTGSPARRLAGIERRVEQLGSRASVPKLPTDSQLFEQGFLLCKVGRCRGNGWQWAETCKDTKRIFADYSAVGDEARVRLTFSPSRRLYEEGWTLWRNGRPIDYTNVTNDNNVRSFVHVVSQSRIDYVIGGKTGIATPPDGCRWAVDTDNRRLVKESVATGVRTPMDAVDVLAIGQHVPLGTGTFAVKPRQRANAALNSNRYTVS